MIPYYGYGLVPLLLLCTNIAEGRIQDQEEEISTRGTNWAVLVAGSNGYENYRHQVVHPNRTSISLISGLIWLTADHKAFIYMFDIELQVSISG